MNETIAVIHETDIAKARQILRGAIAEASEAWLSSAVIGDALMLEFIELAGRSASPGQIAAHLTRVATQLQRAQSRAH